MILFYISALVAVVATAMVITRKNAVHALLYLIVSLLSVAFIFFLLGAAFAAALEVIIYAGAIMVLFLFVVMTLNLGAESEAQEGIWLTWRAWTGPATLCLVLAGEMIYVIASLSSTHMSIEGHTPKDVGMALYGPYAIGVELASLLLLAGIVGAWHLGRRTEKEDG